MPDKSTLAIPVTGPTSPAIGGVLTDRSGKLNIFDTGLYSGSKVAINPEGTDLLYTPEGMLAVFMEKYVSLNLAMESGQKNAPRKLSALRDMSQQLVVFCTEILKPDGLVYNNAGALFDQLTTAYEEMGDNRYRTALNAGFRLK